MTKDKVFTLLCGGAFISGQEIGDKLGISRAAVWKAINSLKADGHQIESVTNRGYRLTKSLEKLSKSEILTHFSGNAPEMMVLAEVDSTNTVAKQLAEQGAPHGPLVIADCQTGGRGRLGRSFASPSGVGVYFSAILRPEVEPGRLMHLTAVAAVAAREAILAACGAAPGIKWTNDLIFGTKKVAGILTEMSLEAESGRVNYAIVGIGINCNQGEFPAEIAEVATSIFLETGEKVDRNLLAAELGKQILDGFATMFTEKAAWMARYRTHCMTVGREIRVVRGNQERFGRAISIDDDGGLLVEYQDGETATVNSGEVSVRGMYGYL